MPEQANKGQHPDPTTRERHDSGRVADKPEVVPMPPRPKPVKKLKDSVERAVNDKADRKRP